MLCKSADKILLSLFITAVPMDVLFSSADKYALFVIALCIMCVPGIFAGKRTALFPIAFFRMAVLRIFAGKHLILHIGAQPALPIMLMAGCLRCRYRKLRHADAHSYGKEQSQSSPACSFFMSHSFIPFFAKKRIFRMQSIRRPGWHSIVK